MITGMRGLCNGLGPAVFGLIFSLFHVDLKDQMTNPDLGHHVEAHHRGHFFANGSRMPNPTEMSRNAEGMLVPGPPFVFGALMVMLAMLVTAFIPELIQYHPKASSKPTGDMFGNRSRKSGLKISSDYFYTSTNADDKKDHDEDGGDLEELELDGKNSDSGTESNLTQVRVRDAVSSKSGTPMSESKAISNRKRGLSSTCELHIPLMADTDDH